MEDRKKSDIKGWPKSFDITLSNPPYRGKDILFLSSALSLTKENIVFIHPSPIYLNKLIKKSAYSEVKSLIENKIVSLSLFNGNYYFSIAVKYPLAIVHLSPDKNSPDFYLEDCINSFNGRVQKLEEVTVFGVHKGFNEFREKIKKHIEKNGSLNDLADSTEKNKDLPYYVETSHIQGHTMFSEKHTNYKFYKRNFFVIINKPCFYVGEGPEKNYDIQWRFKTKKEAEDFLNFTKGTFARSCLSMGKYAQGLDGGLEMVPILDWSNKVSDLDLFNRFGVDRGTIDFIKENIPEYYTDMKFNRRSDSKGNRRTTKGSE
jgi:hypothetical protein